MPTQTPTRMSSGQQRATAPQTQRAPITAADAGRLVLVGVAAVIGAVIAIQMPDLIRYRNMRRM